VVAFQKAVVLISLHLRKPIKIKVKYIFAEQTCVVKHRYAMVILE
jgi:hypothetical protein